MKQIITDKEVEECKKRIRDWENLNLIQKFRRVKQKPAYIDYRIVEKWMYNSK